jgi:hypothetical protein
MMMAKKQSKKKKDLDLDEDTERSPSIQEETMRVIYSILLFIGTLFLILSAIHKAGLVGNNVYSGLTFLFGIGYFLLPLILCVLGLLFVTSLKKQSVAWPKILGSFLFLIAALGIISTLLKDDTGFGRGGLVGNMIATPMFRLFDFWVTLIFLIGLLAISTIIVFESQISLSRLAFWRKDGEQPLESSTDMSLPEEKKMPELVEMPKEEKMTDEEKDDKKKQKKDGGFSISSIRIGKRSWQTWCR